jgi:hypothetical protein
MLKSTNELKWHNKLIAVIGNKSSGKTCIFTALAMLKTTNNKKYSCALVRNPKISDQLIARIRENKFFNDVNTPAVDSASKNDTKTNACILTNKHIDDAAAQVLAGELPEANKALDKRVYSYELSAPNRVRRFISLIDYSGETLNTGLDFKDHKYLIELFNQANAIVILLPVPAPNGSNKEFIEEAAQIEKSLRLIENDQKKIGARFKTPVILMFTKSDKFITTNDKTLPSNAELVKRIVASEKKILKSMIQALETMTEPGNFKIYATSALGICNENDRPLNVNPLEPISLVEPFAWAAEKSAQKNYLELQKSFQKNPWYRFYTFPFFRKDLTKPASETMMQFPEKSEEFKIAANIYKKSLAAKATNFITATLIIFAAILLAEFQVDIIRFRAIKAKTINFTQSVKWLRNYATSSSFRHIVSRRLFLDGTQAREMAEDLIRKHEEQKWNAVMTADSIDMKAVCAKNYLKTFREGKYTVEASEILIDKKIQKLFRKWNAKFEAFKIDVEKYNIPGMILDKATLKNFSKRAELIRAEYLPEFKANQKKEKLNLLLTQAFSNYYREIGKKLIAETQAQVQTKLSSNNENEWLNALKICYGLKENKYIKPDAWKEFASIQRDRFAHRLTNKVQQWLDDGMYAIANEFLMRVWAEPSYKNISKSIGLKINEKKLIPDLQKLVKNHEIKLLYNELAAKSINSKISSLHDTREEINKTANKLLSLMGQEYAQYKTDLNDFVSFVNNLGNKQVVSLSYNVGWLSRYNDKKRVRLFIDGKTFYGGDIEISAEDSIIFSATVKQVDEGILWNDEVKMTGYEYLSLDELLNSASIKVTDSGNKNATWVGLYASINRIKLTPIESGENA